jgi:hypothetical protein
MTETQAYPDPISQFLAFKEKTTWQDEWIDYQSKFGFTKADVPELIRLTSDEENPIDDDDLENDGSLDLYIHALRALAQIEPETAVNVYLEQLQKLFNDDFLHEEIDGISKQLGAIAIAPFVKALGNTALDNQVRMTAANGLDIIAHAYPELRDVCVEPMIAQLRYYQDQDDALINSVLVDNLVHLKGVEAVDLLAEVFANREIDEMLTGSWAAVQVALGVKQASDFSPEDLKPKMPLNLLQLQKTLFELVERQMSIAPVRPAAKGFGGGSQKQKVKNKKKKS